VHEYSHDDGCSITGGRVYRGTAIPELVGTYFYSDWCGGWLRRFRWDGTAALEHTEWLTDLGQVNSFGVDSAGELYVLTWEGRIGRIAPVRESCNAPDRRGASRVSSPACSTVLPGSPPDS